MKCKCSLNNNYEVIGLCDVEKFNKKIEKFKDKSWTQLIIPEKIVVPPNKPPVKTVMKIFLDIKITSTKIIKTPTSNEPNIEGLSLTGKILLVSGYICQNILYISENYSSSLHSIKFNNPFNTYIVIQDNVDLEQDAFCIYPCIEDVSVRILDNRTLSKSVTLLLFAHQTTEIVPPKPDELLNSFILKTTDTDEEMLRITFNKTTKKLVVTSTGDIYNQPRAINVDVFRFIMFRNPSLPIADEMIKGMENGDDFKGKVDGVSFDYDCIIRVRYRDRPKVILTNYPNKGDTYSMISEKFQTFKVTQTGIVPYVFQNDIILKNSKNEIVVKIQIDYSNKLFLVSSTGNLADNGGTNYFKFSLTNFRGAEVISSTIDGNSNGNNLAKVINDYDTRVAYRIKLEYKDRTKVIITNFPNLGDSDYNPTGTTESFIIGSDSLHS